jgi:hypothetical protein
MPSSRSAAQIDFARLQQAEDTLRFLIASARPDDAWTDQFSNAIPLICGASQRLFPLLASVPADCREPLGHALYRHGMRTASAALKLVSMEVVPDGWLSGLPKLADWEEALRLIGFDCDARYCPTCAKRPVPLTQEDAAKVVAAFLHIEVTEFGYPQLCRLETVTESCPGVSAPIRAVKAAWEEVSALRFRAVVRAAVNDSLVIAALGSVSAVCLALFLDSLGSWSAVAPAALPFVPAVWGVNQLTQHPDVRGRSLVPWSWSVLVGAIYSVLPTLLLAGILVLLSGHLFSMLPLVALASILGSTLVFAVAIRQGLKLSVWRQVYPEPGTDPTVP